MQPHGGDISLGLSTKPVINIPPTRQGEVNTPNPTSS